MEEYMLPCLNKSLFGVDCFGCGGQRALVLLLQGKFTEAFYMYPAIYPIAVLFLFLIFNLFYRFKKDFQIKIGLIIFCGLVMAVNYSFKMFHIFN